MTDETRELTGGCACGAVRYRAEGAPLWVAHCHCTSCRRTTGAAFATFAGVARSRFAFTAGEPAVYHSSPGVTRRFCGRCGTPLTYEGERWPDEIHFLVCTLDRPDALSAERHIFVAEQMPWLRLADGLPRYRTTSSQGDGPLPPG